MELLTKLYKTHAPSGDEWNIICLIMRHVTEHLPGVEVRMDRHGNMYLKKGDADNYPTLACHLDQVQKIHSDDFVLKRDGDMLYGWSETNQRREGLGADDKNGIWVCLRCLKELPCLKVFMATGEEKGCIGSNRADMSFFRNSLYVLEPDCRGGKEIHTTLRGIPCASDEFVADLQAEANGYIITEGKGSDILALTLNDIGVSCANIPAGYYLPHKDDEYTILSELEHTYQYVKAIIQRLSERYPHYYRSETQKRAEAYMKGSYQ